VHGKVPGRQWRFRWDISFVFGLILAKLMWGILHRCSRERRPADKIAMKFV
jgi:hypothetical protein